MILACALVSNHDTILGNIMIINDIDIDFCGTFDYRNIIKCKP